MATVALIGVKGNLGYKIFPELIASDAIAKVHVLSRKKRNSGGGKAIDFQVDYHNPESLEKALKGVDAIINTMGTEGDFQVAKKNLVDAAAKAGVKLYFPRFSPTITRLMTVNGELILKSRLGLFNIKSGLERKPMMLMPLRRDYTSSQFSIVHIITFPN